MNYIPIGKDCVNTHSTFIEDIYLRNVGDMDRYEKRRLQLKAVVDAAGKGGITKIAKQCDIDSTYLSRCLYPEGKKGKKRIGEDIVEKIVFALGDIFDETKNIQAHYFSADEQQEGVQQAASEYTHLNHIKKYDEKGGSMGRGVVLKDQPGQITNLVVTDEWINKNVPSHTGKKNLGVVTGFGDSMKGMFNPGDPLLVDKGVTSCDHDGVFFFRVGEEGFIKRLQRIPSVGIKVISKNKDYETWVITESMDFEVLAKVLIVWKSEIF